MTEEVISVSNEPNPPLKKKRNLPGTPDPTAEVIALSPKTLMATNRFLCEKCGKGFQRDQNLQLHRRGHNLPWKLKLKQRTSSEEEEVVMMRKRVYVCPENTCVHHHPSRALGDLTGIKKHYCRKHAAGEKKWKCDKCSKRYAVHSDWKAHSKTCGTREYKCTDCGTIFSRRDSFITHRAFCEALAEETARLITAGAGSQTNNHHEPIFTNHHHFIESSLGHEPGTLAARHFPPSPILIRPNSTYNNNINDQNIDDPIIPSTGRGLLPLWMAQNPSHVQVISYPPPPSNTYDHHHHQLMKNWDFGNNNNTEVISVPSLFSTADHDHHQQLPSSNISSATSLLQKAADQMGSSATTSTYNFDDHGNNNNKFCGYLYGSSSGTTTRSGIRSDVNDHSALNPMEMYPSTMAKRPRLVPNDNNNEEIIITTGGETRDFLGVGIQSICHEVWK